MTTITEILTNNWKPKLTCLILASVLWYLIRQSAEKSPLPLEHLVASAAHVHKDIPARTPVPATPTPTSTPSRKNK